MNTIVMLFQQPGFLAILAFAALTCLLCWFSDVYEWNGGRSRKNGKPWRYFDTDSQGGRGYRTGHGDDDDTTWISWPLVDRNYHEPN